MQPAPADWPRISSSLFYDDASAAIDWLCRAFGFEVRLKVEGEAGRIEHSEIVFGEGLIMVASGGGGKSGQGQMASPRVTGGVNTQCLCVYVDDVDAHCARARAAGAKIFRELTTSNYGEEYNSDRSYGAIDPEGHLWFFMSRVRDAKKNAR
jgi:uncharacterized glyoxalase superfamily protein PhnB